MESQRRMENLRVFFLMIDIEILIFIQVMTVT